MTTDSTSPDRASHRADAIAAAMSDIRDIEASDVAANGEMTRAGVEAIRDRLVALAEQKELFSFDDFPAPGDGEPTKNCLHRISQDSDGRFALYLNASDGEVSTPAHNHTTWAVVVGFEGQELNKFYERTDEGGVRETHQFMVESGSGVAMLPDDLHSIHLNAPSLNFHCYGLALEQLDAREYYKPDTNEWKIFPPGANISEARVAAEMC